MRFSSAATTVVRSSFRSRKSGVTGVIQAHYSSSRNENGKSSLDWRKQQLTRLENKLTSQIDSDEDLQPMWSAMEKRVKGRRPRSIQESGGKSGRQNIRQTEEDLWQKVGFYDETNGSNK